MSPRCVRAMGVFRALAVFGHAKQAMGERKSGLVEIRLLATALTLVHVQIAAEDLETLHLGATGLCFTMNGNHSKCWYEDHP